ncbi:MAG: DUF2721 domain-containing protein [Verrucomicrobiota bacterium]
MDIGITTPALLFPAISLLLLAYTNRFLALANVIRNLKESLAQNKEQTAEKGLRAQLDNLRRRIHLIRRMQEIGTLSFIFCVIAMFILYAGLSVTGGIFFGISIILLGVSLMISVAEIHISVKALDIHLSDIEEKC